MGIAINESCNNNMIIGNTVLNNPYGIGINALSNYNIISGNNIINNFYGFGINLGFEYRSNFNVINKNNFIGNNQHAVFNQSFFNLWYGNYWEDWIENKPRPINGDNMIFDEIVPWFQFDWKPATEPYDIGGIKEYEGR